LNNTRGIFNRGTLIRGDRKRARGALIGCKLEKTVFNRMLSAPERYRIARRENERQSLNIRTGRPKWYERDPEAFVAAVPPSCAVISVGSGG